MYESRMTEAGDLSETYAFGKIVNRVEDDVYIDYGGKFECVCKVPKPKTTTKEAKESKECVLTFIHHISHDTYARIKCSQLNSKSQ